MLQWMQDFDYYQIFSAVLDVAILVAVFVAGFFLSFTFLKKYYLMDREWR